MKTFFRVLVLGLLTTALVAAMTTSMFAQDDKAALYTKLLITMKATHVPQTTYLALEVRLRRKKSQLKPVRNMFESMEARTASRLLPG